MKDFSGSNLHLSPLLPSTSQPALPLPDEAPMGGNSGVKIELENGDLWRKFHQHTTEMIVNKTGRRMFPTLRFSVSGLDPSATYAIWLELAPLDDSRYKYQNGRWIVNGRAEPLLGNVVPGHGRTYMHPDSPAPGQIWMRQPLSFHRVKLTNNANDPNGNVLLNSMHKYQPRIFITRIIPYVPHSAQIVAMAAPQETQFITVTAYQNDQVIALKVEHNPFAKGFRDNGMHHETKRGIPGGSHGEDHEEDMKRSRMELLPHLDFKGSSVQHSLFNNFNTAALLSSMASLSPASTKLSASISPPQQSPKDEKKAGRIHRHNTQLTTMIHQHQSQSTPEPKQAEATTPARHVPFLMTPSSHGPQGLIGGGGLPAWFNPFLSSIITSSPPQPMVHTTATASSAASTASTGADQSTNYSSSSTMTNPNLAIALASFSPSSQTIPPPPSSTAKIITKATTVPSTTKSSIPSLQSTSTSPTATATTTTTTASSSSSSSIFPSITSWPLTTTATTTNPITPNFLPWTSPAALLFNHQNVFPSPVPANPFPPISSSVQPPPPPPLPPPVPQPNNLNSGEGPIAASNYNSFLSNPPLDPSFYLAALNERFRLIAALHLHQNQPNHLPTATTPFNNNNNFALHNNNNISNNNNNFCPPCTPPVSLIGPNIHRQQQEPSPTAVMSSSAFSIPLSSSSSSSSANHFFHHKQNETVKQK